MKKAFLFVLWIYIIISFSIISSAANSNYTAPDKVELTKTQNQFTIDITVTSAAAYAGAEFGLLCSEGVTVKSVSYNTQSMTAGPTLANHLYWFSYFSNSNTFQNAVTATVTLEYTGSQNTSVVIHDVSVYTKNGAAIDTQKLTTPKTITINREGADNIPPTPSEPVSSSSSNSNAQSSQRNSSSTIISSSSTNNAGSQNSRSNTTNSSGSSVSSTSDGTSTNINSSTNSSQNMAVKGETRNTPGNNPLNTALLVLLIISVGGNAVLGYCVIRYKNNKKGA